MLEEKRICHVDEGVKLKFSMLIESYEQQIRQGREALAQVTRAERLIAEAF